MAGTSIDLEFGDGSYTFKLALPQISELQHKCREGSGVPSGIGAIFARVLKSCVQVGDEVFIQPAEGEFYLCDIVETIRQGLIGGGRGTVNGEEVKVSPTVANRLVDTYVLDRPLKEGWSVATSVLGACVVGYDPPKKD